MSHSDDNDDSSCWLSSKDPKHHQHLALMLHNRTRRPQVSAPDMRPLNSRLSFVCRHVRCFRLWERLQTSKHRLSSFLHARRSRLTEPEKAVRTDVSAECVTRSPIEALGFISSTIGEQKTTEWCFEHLKLSGFPGTGRSRSTCSRPKLCPPAPRPRIRRGTAARQPLAKNNWYKTALRKFSASMNVFMFIQLSDTRMAPPGSCSCRAADKS